MSILFSINKYNQNPLIIISTLLTISLIYLIKNIVYLIITKNNRLFYLIESNISFSYVVYFLGYLLSFSLIINTRFLPLFCLPHLTLGFVFFFMK